MAPLKVFGDDPAAQPKPRTKFADDVVGRFRSGYMLNDRPATLTEWRVTTGDPEVAAKVHDLLGGDAPQEWPARGEDNLEVFTASSKIEIVIAGPRSVRERMVLWGRSGKPIYTSNGEFKYDDSGNLTDEADPDAGLSLAERKQKAKDGTGAQPDIEVFFRLAEEPDLGIFKFQSGSWSLVMDMARDDVEAALAAIDGPARATLALEEVSFVAKTGPRAGQTVQYMKPVLSILGAAA
jgi:hypothetical protein